MQIDVENIKNLLVVSIICDYGIEKKKALRKNKFKKTSFYSI